MKFTKIYKAVSLSLFVFSIAIVVSAASFSFNTDLKVGMTSPDVKMLQIFLNQNSQTLVSSSGPGAPGFETTYYGAKTADAVRRFQELYGNEILAPIGLSSGTGYFGSKTRVKMNNLIMTGQLSMSSSVVSTVSTSNNNSSTNFSSTAVPSIASLSSYGDSYGEEVIIYGNGFTDTANQVLFGEEYFVTAKVRSDGKSLRMVVPDISPGVYYLAIKNENGTGVFSHVFTVLRRDGSSSSSTGSVNSLLSPEGVQSSSNPSEVSEIFSVSPSRASVGDTITVKGMNFDSSSNIVSTNFGNISGVRSSDGEKITFKVSDMDLSSLTPLKTLNPSGTELNVIFDVVTSAGQSKTFGSFILNYK